jgi:hypothetical protein
MAFEFYSTENCTARDFNQCCEGIRNRADLVVFYQFFQRKLMGETSKELSAPGTSGSVTGKNTSWR